MTMDIQVKLVRAVLLADRWHDVKPVGSTADLTPHDFAIAAARSTSKPLGDFEPTLA